MHCGGLESIWSNCSSNIFGGCKKNAEDVAQFVVGYLAEYISIVLMFLQGVKGRVDCHLHPVDGVYKLDFDGATFRDGTAGIGIAVRDYKGEVIASCVQHLFDYLDIDQVEVLAARRVVVFAVELGLSRIHLEVDSLWIITAIQSNMEDLSTIGAIVLLFEFELLSYW